MADSVPKIARQACHKPVFNVGIASSAGHCKQAPIANMIASMALESVRISSLGLPAECGYPEILYSFARGYFKKFLSIHDLRRVSRIVWKLARKMLL